MAKVTPDGPGRCEDASPRPYFFYRPSGRTAVWMFNTRARLPDSSISAHSLCLPRDMSIFNPTPKTPDCTSARSNYMPKATATATVQVTLEVRKLGAWEETCSLAQIRSQAAEGALSEVRSLLGRSDCIRIVGETTVQAILAG